METRTLQDLGYFSIRQEVQQLCLSDEGRDAIVAQGFLTDSQEILLRQDIIEDFIRRSSTRVTQPQAFPSIRDIVSELAIEGRSLSGEQLYAIKDYLESSQVFITYCKGSPDIPGISDDGVSPVHTLLSSLSPDLVTLLETLTATLESPGEVKSSHPAIARLHKEVERKRAERQQYSSDFLRSQSPSDVNIQPVFRDGRIILPIRSDQRRTVDAIVHSSSASGATVFIEPYRLVELNNQVVMAQQQIQIEIARILADLSHKAHHVLDDIRNIMHEIAFADSLYARSQYALRYRCTRVLPSHDGRVILREARHPLLRESAVPISLQLDESIKAVVISGPNAGGKTVTIKTVALFALMHQSLYMVPAAEGTSLPMFHAIYTDIGDDQSIEDSLSTFSAHMKHIGKILNQCDKQSLVIFDELGSGTDPVEGSAIARAVLEYCVEHAGLSLVTSHHSVLKQYAYAHAQVLNASMEFDGKTHEPTFRVISGLPGESHAIDTARRMGLPDTVIGQAEAYLGSEVVEISAIIRGLEERRREAELREQTLDDRARKLTEQLRAMDLQKLRLKQREQQIREEQIGDLSRFIADKRKELENLVAELREGEITRAKTRKVKSFISSLQEKKEDSERRVDAISEKPEPPNSSISFSVGMDVLAGVHRREGRIVRKEKNGTWMVAIGPMKFPMKEEDLKPVSPRTKKGTSKISVVYESKSAPAQATIDVRGKTLSEALESVAVQVEGALVHAMQEFAIIHGMGDGILSRGIHEYLGNHPRVKHYYFARPEDGGYGKTYVQL